jgi:endonuclease YncB( thermonuclease family)
VIGAALPIIAALVLALTVSGYALARAGAGATASACELSEPQMGTVARVDDGETLTLADGSVVRLIGAKAPSPPLGWRGDHPWPMVEEAKQALDQLASGAEVELRFGGARVDRHGHALAQVFVVKGKTRVWLQQALVAEGLARVYSVPDNRACVAELMAREAEARAARKGVWGVSAYRIRDAAEDPEQIARRSRGSWRRWGEGPRGPTSISARTGIPISPSRSSARTRPPSPAPASIWARLRPSASGCGAGSSGAMAR